MFCHGQTLAYWTKSVWVFNSRCGCMYAVRVLCSIAKVHNLELKTRLRQL